MKNESAPVDRRQRTIESWRKRNLAPRCDRCNAILLEPAEICLLCVEEIAYLKEKERARAS